MAAPVIQVENLTKSFGDRLLFGDLTFGINEGEKIGLVARNGTGKTTLLRVLAGADTPDSGSILENRLSGAVAAVSGRSNCT